ncbi:MAG TPA: hypothetical protein VF013_03635 [Candidatus Limnocylindria bacterium]
MADEAESALGTEQEPSQPGGEPVEQPGSGADLLSIALLVFFVSLLLIVAALLALPMIFG